MAALSNATTPWTHVQFDTSIVRTSIQRSYVSFLNIVLTTRCRMLPSQGPFVIELYYKHTPRTSYNLAALAHQGYYNDTIFHRVIRDFMIQGGDPTGTGRGGESIYGGKFEDEITRNLKHTGAGVVSMANAGPNTNGSQFFITLKPTPFLDGKHTVFGRIYLGMGVIQRMGMVATDGDDRPEDPIKIYTATPLRGPPSLKDEQQTAIDISVEHASLAR
jgi:peptidyl-prolyl cis-trans isomerase-like 1